MDLVEAAATGDTAAIEAMLCPSLTYGEGLPRVLGAALYCACGNGHHEIARELVRLGAAIDYQGSSNIYINAMIFILTL